MKFDVSSSALLSHLQSVSKVISNKNTLAILDCFLFNLEDQVLTITASDVETRLVTSVDVMNAEGSGLFAISAKILLEPLKELPEQPLTFEIDDQNLATVVRYENGKYELVGQRGDTYPQQKPLDEQAMSITLSSKILLEGVSRTLFAAADDELRPIMNGVFFDIYPERLTFVASDGHKLVRLSNLSLKATERSSFILPKKPANLLKGLLEKSDLPVTITFDDNNAYLQTPKFELICRLIEGRYPNYNGVIPKESPNKATIDRVSLLAALKRVSVFSSPASSLVKMQLKENQLVVSAQDIDFSTSAEETIACQYSDVPLNIGFKGTFLIEMLSNISATEVDLLLADSARAGVVVPTEDATDEELLMLLMPMILNDL